MLVGLNIPLEDLSTQFVPSFADVDDIQVRNIRYGLHIAKISNFNIIAT
jgi:hypothetical protein